MMMTPTIDLTGGDDGGGDGHAPASYDLTTGQVALPVPVGAAGQQSYIIIISSSSSDDEDDSAVITTSNTINSGDCKTAGGSTSTAGSKRPTVTFGTDGVPVETKAIPKALSWQRRQRLRRQEQPSRLPGGWAAEQARFSCSVIDAEPSNGGTCVGPLTSSQLELLLARLLHDHCHADVAVPPELLELLLRRVREPGPCLEHPEYESAEQNGEESGESEDDILLNSSASKSDGAACGYSTGTDDGGGDGNGVMPWWRQLGTSDRQAEQDARHAILLLLERLPAVCHEDSPAALSRLRLHDIEQLLTAIGKDIMAIYPPTLVVLALSFICRFALLAI